MKILHIPTLRVYTHGYLRTKEFITEFVPCDIPTDLNKDHGVFKLDNELGHASFYIIPEFSVNELWIRKLGNRTAEAWPTYVAAHEFTIVESL